MSRAGVSPSPAKGTRAPAPNFAHMLALTFVAILLGVALATWVIAKVTVRTMKRLDLDPMATLMWLGLAETTDPPAPPRLRDLAPPSPATRVAR